MKSSSLRHLIIIILFFRNEIAFSQLNQYSWSSVKHFTTADGLPSNFTDCLMQDSRGFIWIVTNNGTVRYDGISFKKYEYEAANPNSISSDWFKSIAEDKRGNIWIASGNSGMYQLNPFTDKLIHYRHQPSNPNSISNDQVTSVVVDSSGLIWLGTFGGLISFDLHTGKFQSYFHSDTDSTTISHNQIWSICLDDENNLWLATSAGFDHFNIRMGKVVKQFRDEPIVNLATKQDEPLVVAKGRNSTVWLICKNTGAFCYDLKRNKITKHFWQDKKEPLSIPGNLIQNVFEDNEGNIWISADDGIDVVEKTSGKIINVSEWNAEIKNSNGYTNMMQDKSGKLWLATGLNGIISIDPAQKRFMQMPQKNNPVPASDILTMLDLGKDRFMATTENGVYIFDAKNKTVVPFKLPYHGRELTTEAFNAGSYIDDKGVLFLGTQTKLITYDTSSKAIHIYEHETNDTTTLSGLSCTSVLKDSKGRYWCAVYGGGLDRFYPERGKFMAYKVSTGENSICTNTIHSLFQNSNGKIYIGATGGGFIEFDPDSRIFHCYFHDSKNLQTPSSDNVEYFYESKQGYIYFTTQGGGLNVFDPATKKFMAFTTSNGFASNIISAIIADNHGDLWLGTYSGISRFTPPENPFARDCKISIRNYNVSDGLPCNEFMFGGSYKDGRGNIYLGTACGKVVCFNPDELTENRFKPPVFITGFSLFNRQVAPFDSNGVLKSTIDHTKEITLSYNQNVISFSFAALNFIHPENNQYAYMLKGFDQNWIYTNAANPIAHYTNLDPGKYIFKVKGSNNDGFWNEVPATLKLIITPPFWETWWFRCLALLIIMAAVYSLYRFRLQQILKVQTIRNKISNDLHDDIGSTLNSISIFSEVAKQKSEKHIHELDMIGESSRQVMDAMSDIVWTINPENDSFEKIIFRMRSISHYLLKAKKIEYTFEADEKLNELTLPMQTRKNCYLIFKESLNNLVKYSGAGRASIVLAKRNNEIVFTIRDNGVGFNTTNPPRGNGLNNMKQRADEIKAAFRIDSATGNGTTVMLTLKIK